MKPLAEYKRKRDFTKTTEPGPEHRPRKKGKLIFVVQEHHASHLHYDFRLEWDGVLKSWAVPKGPSLDPGQKRLAVQVEDHPLDYAKFEGSIPKDHYGAGEVYQWDYGTWSPEKGDVAAGLRKGRLEFSLKGKKLQGSFVLVRTRAQSRQPSWLLIKRHDKFAKEGDELKPAETPSRSKKTKKSEKLPDFIPPQLALLTERPPQGKDWVHEIKFDGYRTLSYIENGKVRMFTRSGLDWTDKYKALAKALKTLKVQSAIVDGEVVSLDDKGRSQFSDLQLALKEGASDELMYYLFDLLFLDGKDLRSLPLIARKDRLEQLLAKSKAKSLIYSEHFRGVGDKMIHESCRLDLEGIISKRVDATYVSGRLDSWRKIKCTKRQELVIGGFTASSNSATSMGALLMGVFEGDKLRYAGRVGTGFDERTRADLFTKLSKLKSKTSPFDLKSPRGREIVFVKPKLVAEIKFAEWTADGSLRHAAFQALRADKPARQVVKEVPAKPGEKTKFALSHPDKIVYKKEKLTKADVANYYQEVSPWLLPQIADRPLSLVRCPQGAGAKCFFSKHFTGELPKGLHKIPRGKGEEPWVSIDSAEGLNSLVQNSTLEIHPWGCHSDTMDSPDFIVMDFDPDEGLDFKKVKAAALELKALLENLKLKSFLKTTGGKGLHVVIPISPEYSWESVKNFAKALAQEMVSRHPENYTATMAKKSRKGKIFIDYFRNGEGSTAVAPYALRTHPESAVAMPIAWSELKGLKSSNQFTLKKALAYLKKRKADPWAGFSKLKQKISIL